MSHIFDPLYTTKGRGRGTGLGLVIVNQVVCELGGTVSVESELGKGTRFRLTFPAIPNDMPLAFESGEHELVEVK
jgi:signal transduction histidine kinase